MIGSKMIQAATQKDVPFLWRLSAWPPKLWISDREGLHAESPLSPIDLAWKATLRWVGDRP